jgi:hypothetical protein
VVVAIFTEPAIYLAVVWFVARAGINIVVELDERKG